VRLLTVGHGTLDEEKFIELLRGAGIERLVDVRSFPGSKRHPQFRREAMERWISDAGIVYGWEKDLGGFRKADPDSPNVGLRHSGFRGYADHMRTAEFRSALGRVLGEAATGTTSVMCAESVWWRCHRRLLSDAAELLGGAEVFHLMHDGRSVRHVPTEGVRRDDDLLIYDGGQQELLG
jgi:uncharacterized protein (DUF488 family)